MIVFKTFLKILNKCKAPIIIYTVFLVFFGGFNFAANDNPTSFVASKPDVLIVNGDEEEGITKSFIDYIESNSNETVFTEDEEKIDDAIFYRDLNYVIYIPKNFREDFLAGKNPKIEVKSTGDYQASLAEMLCERYLKAANTLRSLFDSEEEIVAGIEKTLKSDVTVTMTSKLDSYGLERAASFYNFLNYCLLAGAIFIITLVMSIFKSENISKRTIISSMNYRKFNRRLLLSNALFTIMLFVLYVIISLVLIGKPMLSWHGVIFILNAFVFSFCSLTIAFLLGTIVKNKEAINGIVNVIALGSSFLCGAFVPMEWLPDSVLKIAHVLPSYWFISTNEIVKTMEVIDLNSLKPVFVNMGVVLIFSFGFIVITNIVSRKKQKIG